MRFVLSLEILENQLVILLALAEEKAAYSIDEIDVIKHFWCYIIDLFWVRLCTCILVNNILPYLKGFSNFVIISTISFAELR